MNDFTEVMNLATITRISLLSELKHAVGLVATFDELADVMALPGAAKTLWNRPEGEESIGWIPTWERNNLGDGGEEWEIISWDATRKMILRHPSCDGSYAVEVRK